MARGTDDRQQDEARNAGQGERVPTERVTNDERARGESDRAGGREAANEERVQGEGNYEAAREYNDATKGFVKSGRVEDAARNAAPADAAEAEELKKAEQAGKSRIKEEDPAVDHGRSVAGGHSGGKSGGKPS